jgi:hypothetical protein
MPSHKPSWSTLRSEVIRLVLPQRIKSASLSCPINACLQDSALGESSSLSVGGDARCRIRRKGVAIVAESDEPGRIVARMEWLS